MPALVDISPCPDEFVPAEDWIRSVIHSFSALRLSLNKASSSDSSKERKIVVPQLKDRESWYMFCFGDYTSPILSSEGEDELVTDSNLDSIEVRKAKLVDQFNSILSNAECVSSDEEDEEGEEEEGDYDSYHPNDLLSFLFLKSSIYLHLYTSTLLTTCFYVRICVSICVVPYLPHVFMYEYA